MVLADDEEVFEFEGLQSDVQVSAGVDSGTPFEVDVGTEHLARASADGGGALDDVDALDGEVGGFKFDVSSVLVEGEIDFTFVLFFSTFLVFGAFAEADTREVAAGGLLDFGHLEAADAHGVAAGHVDVFGFGKRVDALADHGEGVGVGFIDDVFGGGLALLGEAEFGEHGDVVGVPVFLDEGGCGGAFASLDGHLEDHTQAARLCGGPDVGFKKLGDDALAVAAFAFVGAKVFGFAQFKRNVAVHALKPSGVGLDEFLADVGGQGADHLVGDAGFAAFDLPVEQAIAQHAADHGNVVHWVAVLEDGEGVVAVGGGPGLCAEGVEEFFDQAEAVEVFCKCAALFAAVAHKFGEDGGSRGVVGFFDLGGQGIEGFFL